MFPDSLSYILNRNPIRGGVLVSLSGMADVRFTEYAPARNVSSGRSLRGVRVGGAMGRVGGTRREVLRMPLPIPQPSEQPPDC